MAAKICVAARTRITQHPVNSISVQYMFFQGNGGVRVNQGEIQTEEERKAGDDKKEVFAR